ncbi:Hypothetical predicted protein [Mytilus galloprovincialis]|uniref:Uncharacterized protein n=1 Tax=Mytilus galloprovincialis TaxID=29158 RepID=A0A8B6BKF8_MYTGA|nr:Hypothetical predicted protein [Mytilus galloprovincialis]
MDDNFFQREFVEKENNKVEEESIVKEVNITNSNHIQQSQINSLNKTNDDLIQEPEVEVHKINQSVEKLDFASTNENYKENKAQNLLNNSKLAENYKEIQRVKDQGSEICKRVDSLNIKTTQIEKKIQEIKEEINPQLKEMHENLHVENSGLKQLENSTKEMKENILEEINRHFMDLRIGVNTNFKTLERIQEVNKTCSEMKDLFEARCTQSVTQSDNNTQRSNDLEQKTPDDVLQEVELLVRELKSTLPESTVVIGELLPRYYLGDRNKADAYNEKIGLYNILLRDYCVDTGLHYVQFENMIHSDFYDGIHPNFKGVKLYVRCVKEILNPLLSVRYDKNYPRSFNNGYSVRSNYDQNRSGYNKRDTNGYQGYRQDKHNSYNRYTENTNNGYTDSTNNRYTDNTNNRYTDNTNTSHMHMNNDRDNMYKMFEYMFSGMRDGHY